jgi:hypothetical protein
MYKIKGRDGGYMDWFYVPDDQQWWYGYIKPTGILHDQYGQRLLNATLPDDYLDWLPDD